MVASNIPPVPPGEYLKEFVLPARGLDCRGAAAASGIAVPIFRALLAQQARVDEGIADKLSRWTGMTPGFWLNMQEAADYAAEVMPRK
jgi:addiction module HigA family antidote